MVKVCEISVWLKRLLLGNLNDATQEQPNRCSEDAQTMAYHRAIALATSVQHLGGYEDTEIL